MAGQSDVTAGERIVPMRLQRFLARAGVASRRGSEALITAGRVRVNGVITTVLSMRVDPSIDIVEVDGRRVSPQAGHAYVALHKPAGVLTTMSDPQSRRTVREFVPTDPAGLFPVGRLDRDTTGLLLFTTDGDLAYRLLHPRYHVEKSYEALVDGSLTPDDVARLSAGVELDDGMTAPARVRILHSGKRTRVALTIREGRKRQVRRMFEAIGRPVVTLHRESFGPVKLGDLASGEYRMLMTEEVSALKRSAGQDA